MTILNHYSELDTALLDILADGQWHPSNKIWSKLLSESNERGFTASRQTMKLALAELSNKNILIKGNNESYRFVTKELETWRSYSVTLDKQAPHMQPRYFGGIIEDDGWSYAPLQEKHLIFFKSDQVTREFLSQETHVNLDDIFVNEEGLCRIYAPTKEPFTTITNLKETRPELHISSIRIEANLKRRNIKDLPHQYLSDLCKHYGQFAKVLLRGQMSSIRKHLPEDDDAQQQIYLWVIEAVKRYDPQTSIPFAAYLSTNIRKWVYDLNRKAYGRSIADKELKHARAINKFRQINERNPTTEELSELLEQNVEETRKEQQEISTVVNLRNQQALEYEDYERPIPSHNNTEDNIEALAEAAALSKLITKAAHTDSGNSRKQNLTGLLGLYYNNWGSKDMDRALKTWLKNKTTSQAIKKLLTEVRTEVQGKENI